MTTDTVSIFDTGDYAGTIRRAVQILDAGGLVVLPTETVYGAFGLIQKPDAVARLRAVKGAPTDTRPLTIHLAKPDQAFRFVGKTTSLGQRLINKLWPGPVGLIFDVPEPVRKQAAASLNVAESDLYDNGSITLRCPDHIVATDVLTAASGPAVAIGAGADAAHLSGKVDLALDAGPARYPTPSTLLKVQGDSYTIVRPGLYDARMIERMLRQTILFVCSGNTCRSPMAEAIARHTIAKNLGVTEDQLAEKGISVISAGAMAMPGSRATPAAVSVLREIGVDLTRHRSRPLTPELIHQADVIYVMGRSHRDAISAMIPSASSKVIPLDPEGDVEDPFGSEEPLYRQLVGVLQKLIDARLKERPLV